MSKSKTKGSLDCSKFKGKYIYSCRINESCFHNCLRGVMPGVFPKATDYHKADRPEVPNGLGVVFVLGSVVYLFILTTYFHYLDNFAWATDALTLAGCILFGGFLGLLDDWIDLKWRYKAFTPILACLPLIALREGDTVMATYIFGKIDFGIFFYILIIPAILAVTTNTGNQLAGLNGLETICPLIVIVGLALVSLTEQGILLYTPILICLVLALFNYKGKIFVGNTGTYALGITIASYAIIANNEQTLLIAILPYIFNSSLILLNHIFFHRDARLILKGDKLFSHHRRSLQTLIAHNGPMSEARIVQIISLIFLCSTALAVLIFYAPHLSRLW